MRGSPRRMGFWGRDWKQAGYIPNDAFRFPFNPAARCDKRPAAGKPLFPIYLYIEMHPARLRHAAFYIYIYSNATFCPGATYVPRGLPSRTYAYVTYERAALPQRSYPGGMVRNVAFNLRLPKPAPKTKAASARSAETARATGARPVSEHRQSYSKRGVFVTPPSAFTPA